MTHKGPARRFPVMPPETWIGRDPRDCGIVLDDPTTEPRHAKVSQNSKGRWVLENARSLNGVWLRVQEIGLDRGGQFQCGEQRFLFKVL